MQKCCDKVKTKQEKKTEENVWFSDISYTLVAHECINYQLLLPNKGVWSLAAHECINYQLLLPDKGVWSLSFTTEVFSLQGMYPTTNSGLCKNFLYSIEIFLSV